MLTKEKNKKFTEVGPGTPAGQMLRQYWHPILLSSQLEKEPVKVRFLGEDLVLFRGEDNQPHLIEERCPHRGTSMSGGRIEGNCIRCCYHGWMFDGNGQCVDMPGERGSEKFIQNVKIKSYPVQNQYGFIFAYLGTGEPPVLPPYDIWARPDLYRRLAYIDVDCNFLQMIENSVDPVHTAVLHVASSPGNQYIGVPQFDYKETEYGIHTTSVRPEYVREVDIVFPLLTRISLPFGKPHEEVGFWITPIDDTHCRAFFSWCYPVPENADAETIKKIDERIRSHMLVGQPEDAVVLSDPIFTEDKFAAETQGPIVDRSKEILGESDKALIFYRKMYEKAIDAVAEGNDPKGIIRQPLKEEYISFDVY